MLEATPELLDKRLNIKSCAASVYSVIPMFCMRTSRKGTQVKVTLSLAEVPRAEVGEGHVHNSEGLLEKLGPV